MPKLTLSDPERRRLTLAALSGVSPSKLAEEYGVGRSYIYKLKEEAEKNYLDEWRYWTRVKGQVESKKRRLAKEEE